MESNTFGDPNEYKTLTYISEKMVLLNLKDKARLSGFLTDFNILCLKIDKNNIDKIEYFYKLIRNDYKVKLFELENRYDKKLISYIKNFIYTKLKQLFYGSNKKKKIMKKTNNLIGVCLTGSPKPFYETKAEFLKTFKDKIIEASLNAANCGFLVTNDLDSVTVKMKTAEDKGIKIVTYENFKNSI